MISLYLVRHGQCVVTAKEYLQGQVDSPLTELGVRQAKAAAERLASVPVSAVYASDLCRTVATAEPIAERHNLPVIKTPLIREMHLGEAQGLTVPQFKEKYPEAYAKWQENALINRPPGAERFEDVIERCGKFLEQIKAVYKDGETIVAAVHIGSVSGLLCAALNMPVQFYVSISVANASLSILDLGEETKLRLLNDTCHLHSVRITD